MNRMLGFIFFVFVSGNAMSEWTNNNFPNGLTIKNYSWYWDGANTVVEVQVMEPITTNGCARSDYNATTNMYPRFAHWVSGGSPHMHNQHTLAILAAAEAQGKKVDLNWSTSCHGVSGRLIWGVRINNGP